MRLVHPTTAFGGRDVIGGLLVGDGPACTRACTRPGHQAAALAIASLHNKPCFDLRGGRFWVSRWLQAALGTPSARRGVVWVYPVVALPGEVVRERGKVPRGAVT